MYQCYFALSPTKFVGVKSGDSLSSLLVSTRADCYSIGDMIDTSTSRPFGGSFSCLMVEDDKAFASMAAAVIRQEHGQPTVACDLASARNALAGGAFDLVLLDNHLPDGKGYDFFEQIVRCSPQVPVVMITTEGSKPLVLGAIAAGARGYICKPFTPDQVKARVLPLLPAA